MGQGLALLAIALSFGVSSITAIGGYVWSLHVARVRAHAEVLDARIASTREQIGRLETEWMLRSRLVQQERWAATLGLRTPEAAQYSIDHDELPAAASARRADLAARAPGVRGATQIAGAVAAPVSHQVGYAPGARQKLDALIGAILR